MSLLFQKALLLTLLFTARCAAQPAHNMNEISQNGMTVAWKIEGGLLRLTMTAPTAGWVAIGFNTDDELAGTDLVMGCVVGGQATLSDRYIIAPGQHRSIADLGGTPAAQLVAGSETSAATAIEFSLPMKAADRWHHDLAAGKKYHLLMAFSREDDFAHHSMMRTSVEISL